MSSWNIWLILRDLINSFKKTFVFFLHVTSKRFCQDSNYWSSVVRHISNSMFLLIIEVTLSVIISQIVSSNVFFNFRLIIILKTLIIFNGWRMLVRILFFRIGNILENICYCLVLIFLIFITNFYVRRLSLIDIFIDS